LNQDKNKLIDKFYKAEEKIDQKIKEIKDIESKLSESKDEI
jgi:hypothetical protein